MNLDKIPKSGTTISRKRFWDKARDIVLSLQKKEGRNVSVDERKGAGTVINVLRPDNQPENITGACCVDGECSITTSAECSDLGGNYLGNGTTCEDVDCEHGACCDPDTGECTITTLEECEGEFQGYGTDCDPNPCPTPPATGACCTDGVCTEGVTQADCESGGGTYQGEDTTCDGVDCTEGACCNDGDCTITTNAGCLDSGGVYQGGGTTCDPNPCELPACTCPSTFAAFDGSGRRFETLTKNMHGTQVIDSNPDAVITIEFTSTRIEHCLGGDCSCDGVSESSCVGDECLSGCVAVGDGCSPTTSGCAFGDSGCLGYLAAPFPNTDYGSADTVDVISATNEILTWDRVIGGQHILITGNLVLSDECFIE